jgi:hypothetical protein
VAVLCIWRAFGVADTNFASDGAVFGEVDGDWSSSAYASSLREQVDL